MRIEARIVDPLEARFAVPAASSLRVCLVVPQSGALGMTGPSALDAALLAAHEINVAGGVNGRYVDLVLVDGGQSTTLVADEVRALMHAVDVVTGFHTSDVHRAIERVVAGRTPYVFTPPHEGGRRRTGTVCIGTDPTRQLRSSIGWVAARHSVRRWAMVGNDYIWPKAVHRVARPLIARAGGQVVMERRVPLGRVPEQVDRLIDELRRSGADAVLLSLVGRDLAYFNRAVKHAALDRRLVRLSGALEENGLFACGGDDTGTLYASMESFATLTDDRRLGLGERYAALFGTEAPVLDTYAEGVYDGVHLVAALAAKGSLNVTTIAAGARQLSDLHRDVHLARADGLEFAVVS